MVNKETFANLCSGMNLDAPGYETRKLRNQSRNKRNVCLIESMRNTMIENRPQSLVEQDLEDVAARGVFLEDHIDGIGPAGSAAWSRARSSN